MKVLIEVYYSAISIAVDLKSGDELSQADVALLIKTIESYSQDVYRDHPSILAAIHEFRDELQSSGWRPDGAALSIVKAVLKSIGKLLD